MAKVDIVAIQVQGEDNLSEAFAKMAGGADTSSHIDRVGSFTCSDRLAPAPTAETDLQEGHTGDEEGRTK